MNHRFLLFVPLLLLSLTVSSFGLELTQGNMRIVLFENTGRFSAYYKSSSGQWNPLFYSQDPRTTVLELRVGDNLYRLGDSSRFKQQVAKTNDGGGQITFTSKEIGVAETFSFTKSANASAADGVRITLRISNLTDKSLEVGARYIIDTYLGEQSRIEFVTPSEGSMTNETVFTGSQVPSYWVSPKDKQMSVALEAVLRGSGVTTPQKIIFANWKRLNDSGWDYTPDTSHNFNLLPYSINDSAVAMYYPVESLGANAARQIQALFGQYSQAGWGTMSPPSAASAPSPTQSASQNPAVTKLLDQANKPSQGSSAAASQPAAAQGDTRAAIEADLKTVNGVLEQIQTMLASPGSVSQSDIDGLRQVLDKLNARKTQSGQQ